MAAPWRAIIGGDVPQCPTASDTNDDRKVIANPTMLGVVTQQTTNQSITE